MAAPLPQIVSTPVRRFQEVVGGVPTDQLRTLDGQACVQFVRTLRPALMGKVKSAVACERQADGTWRPRAGTPLVAVKQIYKWCIAAGTTIDHRPVREDPRVEIQILQFLSAPGHPNVLRMLHLLEDDVCLYMVLEFLDGGELFDQVERRQRVPEDEARRLIWQIVQGVKYLHAKGWCHRDISLENAMLSNAPALGVVKLIDFGLSLPLPPGGAPLPPGPRVGKERYMPPEMYAQGPYSGPAVDLWTVGMCIFVLLFGIYPYTVASAARCQYFAEIAAGRFLPMLASWGYDRAVSGDALDLMNGLLCPDAGARLTVAQVEAHAWFRPLFPAPVAVAPGAPGGAAGGV